MFFRNILIQLMFIISLSVFVSFTFLIPTLNLLWLEQSGHVETIETYRSAGTIYLLAKKLNTIEQGKQIEALAQLQIQFNYVLTLKKKEPLSLTFEQAKVLAQGQTLFDSETSELYYQLGDNGFILVIGDIDNAAPIHQTVQQDEVAAILNLIYQDLLTIPSDDWSKRMAQIDLYFSVTIKMIALSDSRISEIQREDLLNQEIVFQYIDPLNESDIPEYILQKIPNHNTVVVIGPLNSVIEERIINDVLMRFVIIIGVLVFLPLSIWLFPSWRTSASLLKATENFGHGDLSSRSTIFKGSNLNGLTTTFNKMAARVETLYDNNIMLNSAVSHELRTPLTRIEFAIELLRNPSLKQQEKQMHRIEKAISEIRVMSDEMDLYARFDRERPNFEFVMTELTTWFDNVKQEWIYYEKGTTINVVHVPSQIYVPIEPFYFRRMINNIIRNAYKHSLNTINVHIEILNDECLITIENDGTSIEDKYKEKVFEPFFRLDQSRSRNSGGTGLGLAIVKQIVIWHHGKVWIEDSHSGGVKVKITLPVKPSY
ncbi:ATP-binding protein [Moritella viscosa]|uniref:ATP-binding protein n=1 Tax=Moritella viscosa TaxID=80854 RepID=UPI00091DA0FD|nr:ATP-binding protein [Moritella viscosa]SHN98494.1 Periplasmic sensor signal transduction histidine kinase [Moritella viscosa]SHN98496.1 Periplasmic sensor signal transduction histidine kinase [Moritella viscosa]SHO00384.1 Periplasmic sensor signal transduction histidine kinase [Moritella viscosa]